ncbi:hypothetical protein [Actinoplanes sp. NPDC051494]|uniref:hypothetical protein n=1 Tax=Actinoplanes sp. NPDC051494 TaxID=3363907 RepID=UPI0037977FCE
MSVGYFISVFAGHVPMLAVLIGGAVLLASRRERLGKRSANMAYLGLGALALGQIIGLIWTLSLPSLYQALGSSVTSYGMVSFGFTAVTTLLGAAGLGLIIAALVVRPIPAPQQ